MNEEATYAGDARVQLSEISRAAAKLDVLAARVVRWAAPVRFHAARTLAELDAVYRMQYRVVIERGWGRAADFPDGLERDAFDDRAIRIIGQDGNRIVASNRIVLPSPGQPLPTEKGFGLEIEPRGQIADWSRTIVTHKYSNSSHRVLAGLVAQSWIETRRQGFSNVCGIFSQGMLRLYCRLGLHFSVLSSPRRYWNEERVAVSLNVRESAQAQSRRWAVGYPESNRSGD